MISIDNYSIEQLFSQNKIIIYLPALFHTANSTMDKLSWTRKEKLTTDELAAVLMSVIKMFEGEKENEDV